MTQQQLLPDLQQYPPWQCHGEAYILNYWANPHFLQHSKRFNLHASRTGHMLHVVLLHYQHTPIGSYDALFIVDHPVQHKQRYSSIVKIWVSNSQAVLHGQTLWGLPHEIAEFHWTKTNTAMYCEICVQQKSMMIQLNHSKNISNFYINSHQLPDNVLNVQQQWQGQRYLFTPQFRGQFSKLKSVQWHNTADLFPNFNHARYIDSFYMPEFQLLLPEAKIQALKSVPRETF